MVALQQLQISEIEIIPILDTCCEATIEQLLSALCSATLLTAACMSSGYRGKGGHDSHCGSLVSLIE